MEGRGRGDERGQVVPLVLAVLALAIVVLLMAVVPLGRAAAARAQARTAADAAALAGAAAGEDVARAVAEDNGAALVGWRSDGRDVWVEVRVGEARATAKARREEGRGLPYTRPDVARGSASDGAEPPVAGRA